MPVAWAERRRLLVWGVVAAWVLAGGLALLAFREPLGRFLFPDAALAGLLAAGDTARAEGELTIAAEYYRAAAAREPDHPRVRLGREALAEAALDAVDQALLAGRPEAAREALRLAEQFGAPGAARQDRAKAIEAASAPSVESLLRRAMAAEPTDPVAALQDYQQVLAREPDNALARHGRQRLLAQRLAVALQALDAASPATAAWVASEVAAVQALDPGHIDLPEARKQLAEAGITPLAEAVAAPAPAALAAAEALRWRGIAEEAMGRGEWPHAREALQRSRALDPGHEAQTRLERRLADAGAQP